MENNTLNFSEETMKFLEHHGILGMHWGRKKALREKSSISYYGKKNRKSGEDSEDSEDFKEAKQLSTKPINSLSNKELETYNRRLQLEDQYRNLTSKDREAYRSQGEKFITDTINNSGKQLASRYITAAATYGIDSGISKANKKFVKK